MLINKAQVAGVAKGSPSRKSQSRTRWRFSLRVLEVANISAPESFSSFGTRLSGALCFHLTKGPTCSQHADPF